MSVQAAAGIVRSATALLDGPAAWLVPHAAARSLIECFAVWADCEERARAARFVRDRDRGGYTISHAALRLVLGSVTNQPPASVRIRRLPGGKPVLADANVGVRFSLSHTEGATLIAVSPCCDIGADIEVMPVEFDAAMVLTAIAGAAEAAQLQAATVPGGLARAVLRLWVIKEAALKLDGVGLALDPRCIVAEPRAPNIIEVRAAAAWTGFTPCFVRVLDVGSGFAAAAAIAPACDGTCVPVPVIHWPAEGGADKGPCV
ncbi:MAG: 4-phosphopantetheinyl transferase [Rubritepida sp.]|nr:4-phosphopantetheinyl transferase [Rubritepida sp.]